MLFKRLCKGVDDKGRLLPSEEIHKYITDPNVDWYVSLFDYGDSHYAKWQELGSVAGITDVTTKVLFFDFDSSSDVESARSDAVSLCERLIKLGVGVKALLIHFSGRKGFSVEIHTNRSFTPSEVKRICLGIAGDLETLDKQIYNASRIIRVSYTKHPKSGLYKIPLTLQELTELSLEQILQLAKKGETEIEGFQDNVQLPTGLLKYLEQDFEVKTEVPAELQELDLSQKPPGMSPCKYAILNGFFRQGTRSNALMALAAHFKSQGFPKEVTYRLLKGAVELQEKRYPSDEPLNKTEIWNNIIGQVYGPHWKGATYSCKEHAFLQDLCPVRNTSKCGINKKDPIVTIDAVATTFKQYAENIDKNTILTGIKSIDSNVRLQTSSHVVIAGCSGAGKTTFLLNLLQQASSNNVKAYFQSLDMGSALVYQKLAHKVSGLNDKKLYELYKTKQEKKIQEIDNAIKEMYKHTLFDFRSGVSIEDITENLKRLKDKYGAELKIAVFDYLAKIRGPYSDETANLAYIAPKLSDLANETETLIVSLAQIGRAKGGPATPLLDSRVSKGSSAIEESATLLLGLWRPGYNKGDQDRFLRIAALKTRMGREFSTGLYWNGLTSEIRDLTAEEEYELEVLESQVQNELSKGYD